MRALSVTLSDTGTWAVATAEGDFSSGQVELSLVVSGAMDPGMVTGEHISHRARFARDLADQAARRLRVRIGDRRDHQHGPHPAYGGAVVDVFSWWLETPRSGFLTDH